MSDEESDRRNKLVPFKTSMPTESRWVARATGVADPLSAWWYGHQVRANTRAVRAAIEHQKVVGQLMDAIGDTVVRKQKVQDTLRTHAVRQAVSDELYANEVNRQYDLIAEDQHLRLQSERRRMRESLEAELAVLEAKHNIEAKRKFKTQKFKIGEARAEARKKDAEVDKATAEAAAFEIEQRQRRAAPKRGNIAQLLEENITALQETIAERDADGEDTADLHAELQALRRLKSRVGGVP